MNYSNKNKIYIYCFSTKDYLFLKKLPNNIIPIILGDLVSSNTFLKETNGKNISNLNKYYAEMTGIYWVLKNKIKYHKEDDWVGVCHYRRLWLNSVSKPKKNVSNIFSKLLINENSFFTNHESILVDPIFLKRETIFEQFINNHGKEIFDFLHKILEVDEYADFKNYLNMREFSPCNMFITKPNIFINYCDKVFPLLNKILEECLKRNLCIDKNIKLPAFFIERYTPYWFIKNSKVGYLSYGVFNNFFISNLTNILLNPLKLPFSSSFFPTKLDI